MAGFKVSAVCSVFVRFRKLRHYPPLFELDKDALAEHGDWVLLHLH
jgi:hypothetical protein